MEEFSFVGTHAAGGRFPGDELKSPAICIGILRISRDKWLTSLNLTITKLGAIYRSHMPNARLLFGFLRVPGGSSGANVPRSLFPEGYLPQFNVMLQSIPPEKPRLVNITSLAFFIKTPALVHEEPGYLQIGEFPKRFQELELSVTVNPIWWFVLEGTHPGSLAVNIHSIFSALQV